uniref:Nitrogenase-stabilizing/protective protein NifW n=1 Tax=Candidatus Kentrum sp. FW TaxID=2126338 RepID=A0A450THT1_9GAMM|nr:MAG: nitrogenase-stabilizing/protective protein [Candidatus Kentron sp. FW]
MRNDELEREMQELESTEEFLDYFGISHDRAVVQVNRLHILQRFHDYIRDTEKMPRDQDARKKVYAGLLECAYRDFVQSDARTEKVFKVFHRENSVGTHIPLSAIGYTTSNASEV